MSLVLFVHNLNDVIQLLEMASHKEKKNLAKENKLLLMELPYSNCKDLKNAHPQYNALLDTNLASIILVFFRTIPYIDFKND